MLLLFVTITFTPHILGFPRIPIGGLFDSDEMIQKAFEISIEAVNKNIFNAHARNVLLKPRIRTVNKDAFQVKKIACELIKNGVAGIFGPQDKSTGNYIQSMSDILDIPYIVARWESETKQNNVINLYPHPDTLSMVFLKLIQELGWKEYAILYDNTDSLIRMNRLLKLSNTTTIYAMVYHLGSGPSFRQVMKEVKLHGYINIIIDCSYDILESVLKQAQQVGIMSAIHKVIVTSLDLQTLNLEPYTHSGVNLTGVRLIDPESSVVQQILHYRSLNWSLTDGSQLKVEAALAYDAVQLFANGISELRGSVNIQRIKELSCNGTNVWGHGFSLSNYMRNEQMDGLSGSIKFDTAGFRSEFQLDIVNLGNNGLYKIGQWEKNIGIQWKSGYKISKFDSETVLSDKHFLVLISLQEPYGMLTHSSSSRIGNDRYEGFAVDIIKEIGNMLEFNYTFEIESNYGNYDNKTKKWTGMLGRIIEGTAHLAITDLTITEERERAVDFSDPFMTLGISVLYRKPSIAPPGILSFLGPFSKKVWMHLVAAYISVAATLFVIGKLSPAEWKNPYPCIKEPKVLETPYTPKDTPFLVIGTILKANTGLSVTGISTRLLIVAWQFFALIIVSTYIANLAAALSTKSVVWHFQKAEELAYQTKIKYGAKPNGSTLKFFEKATYEPYKLMYEYMKKNEKEVLLDNEDGIKKVQHDLYAFFMESSSIKYTVQRKCNLSQIGELLDSKGYGIAMKKGAPYRAEISSAIIKMQETAKLAELEEKWWKHQRGGSTCDEEEKAAAKALTFEDVSGVFLIMISGVMLSWIFAIVVFLWEIRNTAIKHNISYKEEFIAELKFLMKFNNTRSIKKRKGSSEMIKYNSRSSL